MGYEGGPILSQREEPVARPALFLLSSPVELAGRNQTIEAINVELRDKAANPTAVTFY